MTKRVYKFVEGEFVQVEGPLWEGLPLIQKEMDAPGPDLRRAPAVIIPPKHRSAT